MLSNCMMLKIRAITKICSCAELIYTSNTCGKRFIMIVIISRYFEIFASCQGSMRNFSKHHYKCKTVSTKFIAREETVNIKAFTVNPTKQFCLLLWLKSRSAREAFTIQLLWATAELSVASFIVLSTQWMKEMMTWSWSQITSYCF